MSELDRICIENGRPYLRRQHVLVRDVLNLLATGESSKQILKDYPALEGGDITAVLEYAARQADQPISMNGKESYFIDAMIHMGKDASGKGDFRFNALPSPGDHVHIGNIRGSTDVLHVVAVEHHPVKQPPSVNARPDPYVTIQVEEIGSYGDWVPK